MARSAHAYIPRSNSDYVLAAVAVNDDGIRYEQDIAVRIPQASPPAELGQQVLDFVSQFASKHRNLRNYKKSEWPAFRASGLRTIRAFETDYDCVVVEQDPARLTMTRFGTGHSATDTVHLSSAPTAEEIGRGLVQLRERMTQHATNVS
jgi:hypothetical protein